LVTGGDIADKKIQPSPALFYVLLHAFDEHGHGADCSQYGIMWVAVEATTLTSFFLVGFNADKKAVEAAWKNVIVVPSALLLQCVALFSACRFGRHSGKRTSSGLA
jgi:NADH:ubiquinone oxidoreductase subunit 5 (subunit L)/multisubunit Na+/H+ antiporter MnhA subunit